MYRELNDYEILYLIKENDEDDFDIIFEKYKPLINRLARKYLSLAKKYGLEYDDLCQIANIVLFNAIKNFSTNHDNMFYTYLTKAIEYGLIAELRRNNTKKMTPLNNSVSYDEIVPNTNLSYIEIIPDYNIPKKNYDNLIFYHDFIVFKNSLSFENACIFELLYNGYKKREISRLLRIDIRKLKSKIRDIKNRIVYI